jgi:hypothetical protein
MEVEAMEAVLCSQSAHVKKVLAPCAQLGTTPMTSTSTE